MLRLLCYKKDGTLCTEIPLEQVKQFLDDPEAVVWMDFEATLPEEDEPIMHQVFNFHPLAIEDALHQSNVPKVDDWEDYLYIVLHTVMFEDGVEGILEEPELDIFLGKNYMVTHHDQSISAIERVWDLVHRDYRHLKNGPDHLLYRLTDEVVASYMPVVEAIDDEIDRAEDEVFDRPTPQTLEKIFTLKRATLHLRRIVEVLPGGPGDVPGDCGPGLH